MVNKTEQKQSQDHVLFGEPLQILLAGFGGQGVLFAGKMLAYTGLIDGKHLSWLPSYGPEMRGGTANCSVCLSDDPIGSPLITSPNVLIAMNQPSFDKFYESVVPGGAVFVDSTFVKDIPYRDDVVVYKIPATQLAEDNDLQSLANVILVGKVHKELQFCCDSTLDAALAKCVPARKQHLLEPNKKAIKIGKEN